MQDLQSEISEYTCSTKEVSLFYKEMQGKKKELKGTAVSQANAMISREWTKIKANNKEKKYSDLHQRIKAKIMKKIFGNTKKTTWKKWKLSTYTRYHIIGYHLFLREQLDKMTGENRKNYQDIASRGWKEIKEWLMEKKAAKIRQKSQPDEG